MEFCLMELQRSRMVPRTEAATYASHVWSALLVATLVLGYAWHVRSAAPHEGKARDAPMPRPLEDPPGPDSDGRDASVLGSIV